MRGKSWGLALGLLAGLSGCTHLEVSRYESGTAPPSGYAYMLDFTQYQVVLTRTLSKCTLGEMPVITAEAAVTPLLAPDGDQVYVIDPASMISAFKTSDVSIEYKDGRLVSFNASTVDKTGEVLGSVITTAGKVAMMAAVPIPVAGGTQFCSDIAVEKLKVIDDGRKPIKDATADLEEGEGRLSTLTARYAAKPTDALRKEIKKLNGDLKVARDALEKRTKAVSDALAWLTDKVTVTWPETSAEFHRGPGNPLGPATLAKWLDLTRVRTALAARPEVNAKLDANNRLVVAGYNGTAERLGVSVDVFRSRYPDLPEGVSFLNCAGPCAAAKSGLENALVERQVDRVARAAISMHIVRRGSYGSENPAEASRDKRAGLRYRVPAAGTFYVCTFDEPCQSGAHTPLSRTDSGVAQLGTVFNLPFSSPAFASGSVSAKFDDQGRLLSAGLKRDSSTALGAANAVSAAVDQLSGVLTAAERAPITEASNATKLAEARAALAKAEGVKTPLQLAEDRLALMKVEQQIGALGPDRARDLAKVVEIANLEDSVAAIERKRAGDPNAGDAAIAAQYDAQTLVLNSRRATAEAELRAIQADRALATARAEP